MDDKGFTLLEALIGMAILAIVCTAVYFSYANVVEIVQAAQYNSAALGIIEGQVETVRNMRYEDVGTVGGVPAGLLPQSQDYTLDGASYVLTTYIRSIDDPFDGTLGGSPGDTAPADYKLVEFQVVCTAFTRYRLIRMATYVAPKNLESTSKKGNLFIRVFDAQGAPVPGATVHVQNSSAVPAIDLTDITNVDGMLQLVDTATGSAVYRLTVTKEGYSSDRTYAPGSPPNPLKPDATVATQQLTITSLAIDRAVTVNVRARDRFCAPAAGMDFLLSGAKLIGTAPDTLKYNVAHATDTQGMVTATGLEWDDYILQPTDTTLDIAGTLSSLSWTADPNTTRTFALETASRSGDALLVSVTDQAGNPVNGATVRVTMGGYDRTLTTGTATVGDTDWSAGQYASHSAYLDPSAAGMLQLLSSGSSYAGAGTEWLTSRTFDMATTSAVFTTLSWNPTSQPPPTGADSVRFQLAGNNDDATWTFIGPDMSGATYYTAPGEAIPPAFTGFRYLRYRVYLQTANHNQTPSVDDVSIGYSTGCILPGQAYFNGLTAGTATVEIDAAGYQSYSGTVVLADDWQRTVIQLTP